MGKVDGSVSELAEGREGGICSSSNVGCDGCEIQDDARKAGGD